ncbi:putative magnesium chelatase accessory protein [Thioflavicoccus mobilis 8321]|uniref:Putative magnesium chelatase accessory protein n=1 Tax=Thioflavicoccus mobilis 8321 TaxID=765912 RepID=L0H289_9GAMM|nr:alpha/beta fold hydrolase BchO [Thioflavicoccus mobilis]AGA91704.1 putative magnesium chelatase accessory protein [Thioflavicoccus mobilis 8321]
MTRRLVWERDGGDWPNREHSRFVSAAGLRWHIQQAGSGPTLLLVHGTAASTHSWRGLLPRLAEHFNLVAMDLPGHGFSGPTPAYRLSLPGMARALDGLLGVLDARPAIVVGHSAGAAILARMCLDKRLAPRALVSLNGAFLPFGGIAAHLFSPLAKLLSSTGWIPWVISRQAARPGAVERLIRGTGSDLDAEGMARYRRLVCSPGHVAATVAMLANWDLRPLRRELAGLAVDLYLLAAERDRAVPPSEARRIARKMAGRARLMVLPGYGHLAHEERPAEVARQIIEIASLSGVIERRGR